MAAPAPRGALAPAGTLAVTTGVSVVIPCRNEAAYVEAVLDAMRAQDLPPDEIVVVDGGSSDDTIGVIERYAAAHPELPLRIVTAHGVNIAAALNTGIAAARGDVIVRMDTHSRPAPDYISLAIRALQETGAAVVGGIWQIQPGGPGIVARAIARAVAHPMGAGDAAYRIAKGPLPERRSVDTVPFGCFRKSHWQRVGAFNEELLVNEDYEFHYRTKKAGGSVVLDTAIRCQYFARPSFRSLARQYFRYGWWKGRMLRQHPESLRWRQAVPALFLPSWAIAIAMALWVPAATPLLFVAALLYASAVLTAAAHAAGRQWTLVAPTAAAFTTIHTAWSAGITSFFLTGASATDRRYPGGRRPRAGLTGRQLIIALAAIFVLTIVLPPAMASRLSARRIARAQQEVERIAAAVAAAGQSFALEDTEGTVYVGAGADPIPAPGTGWGEQVVPAANRFGFVIDADPWGNHYLIVAHSRLSTADQTRGWVLTAGPNGILETAMRRPVDASSFSGDDIGAVVR